MLPMFQNVLCFRQSRLKIQNFLASRPLNMNKSSAMSGIQHDNSFSTHIWLLLPAHHADKLKWIDQGSWICLNFQSCHLTRDIRSILSQRSISNPSIEVIKVRVHEYITDNRGCFGRAFMQLTSQICPGIMWFTSKYNVFFG